MSAIAIIIERAGYNPAFNGIISLITGDKFTSVYRVITASLIDVKTGQQLAVSSSLFVGTFT